MAELTCTTTLLHYEHLHNSFLGQHQDLAETYHETWRRIWDEPSEMLSCL
jgi:hypothetical protein